MAGENVTERIVRTIFGRALDIVVNVDRDDVPRNRDGRVRRQVMEITGVVPALTDGHTYEPIFVRDALGGPLEWTGAIPPPLAERIERAGVDVRALLEVP
jgi:hypothetical protein